MASLEWTVNAFSLSFAALMIAAAELGDRIGRKRVYIIGLIAFSLASAACALAPTVGLLIAARVVHGAAGGTHLADRPRAAQRDDATVQARRGHGNLRLRHGTGGGRRTPSRWCCSPRYRLAGIFWINIPVIAVVLPLAATKLTEAKGNQARPDLLGLVLAAGSIFGIMWGWYVPVRPAGPAVKYWAP